MVLINVYGKMDLDSLCIFDVGDDLIKIKYDGSLMVVNNI